MDVLKIKSFIQLHVLLFLYSLGGISSKLASQNKIFSCKFLFFYGLVIIDLGIYAIVWQQILKKLPLVTAYANKAVTVIYGLLWGVLVFKESITIANMVGAILIIVGVYMVVREDGN